MAQTIKIESSGMPRWLRTTFIILIVFAVIGAALLVYDKVKPDTTPSEMNETTNETNTPPPAPSQGGVPWLLFIILGGVFFLGVLLWWILKKKGVLESAEWTIEKCVEYAEKLAWNMEFRPDNAKDDFKEARNGYGVNVYSFEKLKDAKGAVAMIELSKGAGGDSQSMVFVIRTDKPKTRLSWQNEISLKNTKMDVENWQRLGFSFQKTDYKDEQVEQAQRLIDRMVNKEGSE